MKKQDIIYKYSSIFETKKRDFYIKYSMRNMY